MKRFILILTLLSIFLMYAYHSFGQIFYNNKIDSMLNLVSQQSVNKFVRELSGDTLAAIGGLPYLIFSRYYESISNPKAAQYIYEKFQSYGLEVRYQHNSDTTVNVIAKKTGTLYPDKYYIICAHYDDIITIPSPTDTIPGADDNASSVSAVLETARILANYPTKYSLMFIAFDTEEIGLYGSRAFVDSAVACGYDIKGVLNMEMLGYDSNNDGKFTILTNTASEDLANDLLKAVQLYQIGLQGWKNINGRISDHFPFWLAGYKAICSAQNDSDFTPYYHTKNDKFDKFNQTFFYRMVKTSFATFASWALDMKVNISHIPLQSTLDTAARTVNITIKFPVAIGTGTNAPRLYYKVNNELYNFINSYSVIQDTFKFCIPGQPAGTRIFYYIAAQDSAGSMLVTLPEGGSGINPPGTNPPSQIYSYDILSYLNNCSVTVPKIIPDLQITRDTIIVTTNGLVSDVNVLVNILHPNDGDLWISLAKGSASVNLIQYLGQGGQNFVNTLFDDSASASITQGSPPFTGSFRPQAPLSTFNNLQMSGNWILRIHDKTSGNLGTLTGWCVQIKYSTAISVNTNNEEIPEKFILEQNFPNPFNPVTNIKYSIPRSSNVILKIYDILGKEVTVLVNSYQTAGNYQIIFNASDLPSGVYFYKLSAGDLTDSKRMIIIK
ncbi:MAG: M28 family peptidase [Ignavibacteria bacterium]|nr:M28 family peptidase [Ignavibacteria bacterium]